MVTGGGVMRNLSLSLRTVNRRHEVYNPGYVTRLLECGHSYTVGRWSTAERCKIIAL